MISPSTVLSIACCLLNSDLAFVIVLSVFARVVWHWLWYRAFGAVISPVAYNFCFGFWKSCCHFPLSGIWLNNAGSGHITLKLIRRKKHIFNGVIDVTNLEHVLHWLTPSYISLGLHFTTLSSFKAQLWIFLCHHAERFPSTAPMPSLSSNLSGSISTGREGIARDRMAFFIKLCYPEPTVGTLPLTGHRCFNFSDVTYDTALPFNVNIHYIWSVGRWIRRHLFDWLVWDLTKCHGCNH